MGFIEDIFSSEEEAEEKEIQIDYLEGWINEQLQDGVEEKYRELEETVMELERNLEELKEGEIPEEAHTRLKSAGETNKEVLVDRLENFLNNFEVPESKEVGTAAKFLRDKSRELEDLSEKLRKNFMFLQKVQEEEAGNLLNSMKRLEKLLEVDERLDKGESLLETVSDLSGLEDRKGAKIKKIENLEDESRQLKKEKEKLVEKKTEEEELGRKEEMGELEEEIEEIRKKRKKKRNGILQRISPLKRGLKKLSYLGSVPGGRDELLQRYIDSPLEALKEDEDASFLKDVLDKLGELLEEEQLDFGKDERKKIVEDMEKISPKHLRKLKEGWLGSEEEIKKKRGEIDKLKKEDITEKLESKIKSKEEEINKIQGGIERNKEEREDIKDKTKERKEKLKDKTRDILNVDLKLK